MRIYIHQGYLTKEQAAQQQKVQVRAINDRIRRNVLEVLRVRQFTFIRDKNSQLSPPTPVYSLDRLEWVTDFAERHHIEPERLYVQIVLGTISAVVICDRVFVIDNDPQLLNFIASIGKKS